MFSIILILLFGDSLLESHLSGTTLQVLERDNAWANSSINFREELRLIMPLTAIYSLSIWLVILVSSLSLRDIPHRGPGSAGPGAKAVFGGVILLVWFFGLGADNPVELWSELTSVEKAFFNYWPGILAGSTIAVLLARQVGEDSTRFVINRLSQGGENIERNR